ncbi:phage integrase SAM-like domain-containing protein [Arenibacter sp. GZD96]|uniref:tyrosine-type recombinase/integrase n=1 Tax=Aurantibrevibacter litoralis TaxID=3106030 RepID=UPI002AFF8FE2|nr:phage integrase SAM-like domain-containing protein [Arenibacter sp. GZD-96]MEA1785591.1 phage integrase SAM-like domain-containing protein [Arenibacter sp. GZD-96]
MATIQFFINQKDPKKEYTINVLLQNGRNGKYKKSIGFKIIGKHWDPEKQAPISESKTGDKNYYTLRRKLPLLRAKLNELVTIANHNDLTINGQWLTKQIDEFFERSPLDVDFKYLTDYTKFFIEGLPYRIQRNGTTGVTWPTVRKYHTTLHKILDFEKRKGKRFKIDEVNLKFHNDFIPFLHKEQKLNLNTIGTYVKCLKTILKSAKQYGIKTNPEVEHDAFRSTNEKTYFVTLNENEIDTIFNLDLSNTPYLNNARNWLIIGVWTGARVSDLLNLTTENFNNGFIEYTSQKTKQKIMLPVHWQVQSIIDANAGELPRKISHQRYNDWVKQVCKLAGINQNCKGAIYITDPNTRGKKIKTPQRKIIGQYPKWQLVSTHTARRSFATNHYSKLPTPVIMSATGHTTEKMLLSYIGKTPKDNAIVLQEFWQKETLKQSKDPNLKVIKAAN